MAMKVSPEVPMSSMSFMTPVARFNAEKSLQDVPATSKERCPGGACGMSRSPPKLVVARPGFVVPFASSAAAASSTTCTEEELALMSSRLGALASGAWASAPRGVVGAPAGLGFEPQRRTSLKSATPGKLRAM